MTGSCVLLDLRVQLERRRVFMSHWELQHQQQQHGRWQRRAERRLVWPDPSLFHSQPRRGDRERGGALLCKSYTGYSTSYQVRMEVIKRNLTFLWNGNYHPIFIKTLTHLLFLCSSQSNKCITLSPSCRFLVLLLFGLIFLGGICLSCSIDIDCLIILL